MERKFYHCMADSEREFWYDLFCTHHENIVMQMAHLEGVPDVEPLDELEMLAPYAHVQITADNQEVAMLSLAVFPERLWKLREQLFDRAMAGDDDAGAQLQRMNESPPEDAVITSVHRDDPPAWVVWYLTRAHLEGIKHHLEEVNLALSFVDPTDND